MSTDTGEPDAAALSPDDAFAALGNETRMEILHALGEADGPLSFSELRDRIGMRDSGQFNYHLDTVVGHFAGKTDEGYELRPAGRRVVEAVLSGAVTVDPVLEPTRVDEPCPLCGAPTAVAFSRQRLDHYCTACAGHYGPADESVPASEESDGAGGSVSTGDGADDAGEYGYLGSFQLPPAGLQGRTANEVFAAASTWGILELLAVASRVCPRCSASLTTSTRVCEDHDVASGFCDRCGNRRAVRARFDCTNCPHEQTGALVLALVADIDVLSFLVDHGINPVSPSAQGAYYAALMEYDEELRSVDPFEARVTLTVDGDALALVVDDDLRVVEAR